MKGDDVPAEQTALSVQFIDRQIGGLMSGAASARHRAALREQYADLDRILVQTARRPGFYGTMPKPHPETAACK